MATWLGGSAFTLIRAQGAPIHASAYAIAGHELIAFDAASGAIVNRMPAVPAGNVSPDLEASPSGQQLFVLGVQLDAHPAGAVSRLSLVDTTSWRVLATTSVPQRMRYPIAGSSSMVLTRDGSRLFVYNTRVDNKPGTFPYWLSVLDAHTLRQVRGHISLPGCGGAELVAVPGQIAVLCYADEGISESLRFVDVRRLRVVARIPVRGVGLVASPEGRYLYVGGLSITQIDAARHRILRNEIYPAQEPWTGGVPFDHSVAITDDGKQLIIGVLADRRDTRSAYALRVFALPSLRPLRTVPLPQFVHFAAGPGGTLILFPMPDTASSKGQVDLLSSGFDRSRPLFAVAGPVLQLALAGPAHLT
jgi:hypothetical protein